MLHGGQTADLIPSAATRIEIEFERRDEQWRHAGALRGCHHAAAGRVFIEQSERRVDRAAVACIDDVGACAEQPLAKQQPGHGEQSCQVTACLTCVESRIGWNVS